MPLTLDFTGERFVPGIPGEIVYEHWHRYALAQSLARGRCVLDVACGEGYGSALLAATAREVTGIDCDATAVQHATSRYGTAHPNLRFVQASAASLPLAERSVDMVVSFETIEHLPQALQEPMIDEFARVLAPDGILLLSSPNRPEYLPPEAPPNPFHLHELDKEELRALLLPRFPSQIWLSQRLWFGSTLWQEPVSPDGKMEAQAWQQQEEDKIIGAKLPLAKYFIVLAASHAQIPFPPIPALSLFSDSGEQELKRLYQEAARAFKLDQMVLAQMRKQEAQAKQLSLLEAKSGQLERSLKEQEAFLHYRESLIGWLRWPLSRLRRRFFGTGRSD